MRIPHGQPTCAATRPSRPLRPDGDRKQEVEIRIGEPESCPGAAADAALEDPADRHLPRHFPEVERSGSGRRGRNRRVAASPHDS